MDPGEGEHLPVSLPVGRDQDLETSLPPGSLTARNEGLATGLKRSAGPAAKKPGMKCRQGAREKGR